MRSFAEIWELEARWIMGPGLLGDVIEYLRGRGPVAVPDPSNPNQVNLQIPLPTVRDEVSGDQVSIAVFVPEALVEIFNERCAFIMRNWYDEEADRIIQGFLGEQVTSVSLARLSGALTAIEMQRAHRGDEPTLRELAAEAFGFSRFAPPRPGFAMRV